MLVQGTESFAILFLQVRHVQVNYFYDSFYVSHWSGHLEQIGSELAQNKSGKESLHFQNGYSYESEATLSNDLQGNAVYSHQQLLMVLSNIGYCKDELSYELHNKYKAIWLQSR